MAPMQLAADPQSHRYATLEFSFASSLWPGGYFQLSQNVSYRVSRANLRRRAPIRRKRQLASDVGKVYRQETQVLPNVTNGITIEDMDLISVKLPPALRAKVAAEARRRNVSQSTIVRESLERVLTGPTSRGETTCADLAGSLVGSFRSGRSDLSTNKKLLADAITSNARRGRKRHR